MVVILDRDGVINVDSDAYIKSPEEWTAIPGSLAAISRLNQTGYLVAIASNQSGIGHGLYDEAMLAKINAKMQRELAAHNAHIDGIFYCPHHPEAGCQCRKPKPGLILQIAEAFAANLSDAIFIGDKLSDIQAAEAAHCKPILVKTGYGKAALSQIPPTIPIYADLAAAVSAILNHAI